jgi:hypothetical protein
MFMETNGNNNNNKQCQETNDKQRQPSGHYYKIDMFRITAKKVSWPGDTYHMLLPVVLLSACVAIVHEFVIVMELLLSIVGPIDSVHFLVDCWHSLVCEDCTSFFVIVNDFVSFHG